MVLLTKVSSSVVPAAICHALNNTLPAVMMSFLIINEENFAKQESLITGLSYIPYVIFMAVCWIVLMKKCNVKKSSL